MIDIAPFKGAVDIAQIVFPLKSTPASIIADFKEKL